MKSNKLSFYPPVLKLFLKNERNKTSINLSVGSLMLSRLHSDRIFSLHWEVHFLPSQFCFLLNEHPSVSLAFPPVGWHRTVAQPTHATTVWAWEKTVEILKQPGHLTSMKQELGCCTRRLSLHFFFSSAGEGCSKSFASSK